MPCVRYVVSFAAMIIHGRRTSVRDGRDTTENEAREAPWRCRTCGEIVRTAMAADHMPDVRE